MAIDLTGRDFVREKVRIRDRHTCQDCRKVWKPGLRRFDVHHKDPKEEGRRSYKLHKFSKLITLCHKCHFKTHNIRERLKKHNAQYVDYARIKEIQRLRGLGVTLRHIGVLHGITRSRVGQILAQHSGDKF